MRHVIGVHKSLFYDGERENARTRTRRILRSTVFRPRALVMLLDSIHTNRTPEKYSEWRNDCIHTAKNKY
jgi:hypothetical protein